MSAYACFVQVIREEHKKKHPEEQIVLSEFSKKCSEKWRQMGPKEKKRFEDMSLRDRERYNREMDDYVRAGGKGKKRKHVKDPGMPKRALSGFFFFCNSERPSVKLTNPEWKVGDVAKEMGRRWEVCSNKDKYERMAQEDKARYEKEMQEYKAGTFSGNTKRSNQNGDDPSESPMAASDTMHEEEDEEEPEDEECEDE